MPRDQILGVKHNVATEDYGTQQCKDCLSRTANIRSKCHLSLRKHNACQFILWPMHKAAWRHKHALFHF